ncbi:hypothetical protein DMB66_58835, partial [Actinoplanes sp. ATCC 53533]
GEKLKPVKAFRPDVAAAAQDVMQKIPRINGIGLADGRKAIGKTGTWEFTGKGKKDGQNGDAWMVGGTKEIAASVWIGREKVNKKTKQMELMPIFKANGRPMNGGSTPGQIWKMFLDSASKAIDADNKDFLPNSTAFVDPSKKGNGVEPPAKEPTLPDNALCVILQQCDDNTGNGNGNGNGTGNGTGNGNGNGDNGGITFPGGGTVNDGGQTDDD